MHLSDVGLNSLECGLSTLCSSFSSCSSNMRNKESVSPPRNKNPRKGHKQFTPIGARFQAHLPLLTGPVDKKSDTSKWLGTKVWPVESMSLNKINEIPMKNMDAIGRGRTEVCGCQVFGSCECIKRHVDQENRKLQKELGPAFDDWKFKQMGGEASANWTSVERKKMETVVKNSCRWRWMGKGFLKFALKALPNQNRETIISYYFNIIVPRKIGLKIRSGSCSSPTEILTDDEFGPAASSSSRRIRKSSNAEYEITKRRYLTGQR